MFHFVLFWCVAVARNAAQAHWTLSLDRDGGHEAARSQRSEEADSLKEKCCQETNESQKAKTISCFGSLTFPEGVKPQWAASCLLS